MKRFSALLFIFFGFLAFPTFAFASGSFTASDYSYNPATHILRFTASGITPSFSSDGCTAINDFGIATADTTLDYYNYVLGPSHPDLSCDTTVFNAEADYNPSSGLTFPTDSTDVVLKISVVGSSSGVYFSQPIPASSLLSAPAAEIATSPTSGTKTVGTPFNVDVKVTNNRGAFNAARATVTISSNLSVTGLHYPTTDSCNLNFTARPSTSNPSFAGAIFGGSATECTLYTLTLTPTSSGTGTITLTDGSLKAYSDNSELLTGVANASFTVDAAEATPTPTSALSQLTVASPLLTYLTSYTLAGAKGNSITHVFINDDDSDSTYPTSTTWEAPQTLSLGANSFTLYGRDEDGNQTATQNISVNRHTLADINGDGNVDLIDASLFAVDWDKTSGLTYILSDMDGNGNVNLTDLSILAKLE